MKKEDIKKQLIPGIIVGFILGFTLTMLVGVNKTDPIPNYIGGFVCCFLPTLLNGTIVLKGTAKVLERELSIGKAILKVIPYALIGGAIGLFTVVVVVENIFQISTCDISKLTTALYEAPLGVVVSTALSYVALKKYEKSVKYTRRTKKA